MYQYDIESPWSKVVEIGTWIFLFLALVPGTALAYFAENSLPTSPLYPVKRDIEAVVLTLVSLNNSTKSFYQLSLANTRVKEMGALLASNNTHATQVTQQFTIVSSQLKDTENSINSVKDPIQQAQMRSQLQTTVIQYQQQLVALNQQLAVSSTTTSTSTQQQTNTTNTRPTATPNTVTATVSTIPTIPMPAVTASTPAISTDFSTLTPQQKQDLENTIQQTTQQLQQLQQDLQNKTTDNNKVNDQNNNQQNNQQYGQGRDQSQGHENSKQRDNNYGNHDNGNQ